MKGKRSQGLGALLFIVFSALGLVGGTYAADYRPLLGLDLQGGVSVVLQPVGEASDESLDQALSIIRQRVDALGVAEPEITRQGNTILVQIPGVQDPDRALELVGQTAELRFRPVQSVIPEEQVQAMLTDPDSLFPTVTTLPTGTTVTDGATSTTSAPGTTAPPTGPADSVNDGSGDADELGFGAPGQELAAAQVAPVTTEAPPTTAAGSDTVPPEVVPPDTIPAPEIADFDPASMLAQLELTPDDQDNAEAEVVLGQYDEEGNLVARFVLGPSLLTGETLESARAGLEVAEWLVRPVFRSGPEGIDQFNAAAATCNPPSPTCPTGQLAITLDGRVISAPVIQASLFTRDQVQITGGFSEREARDLALVLNYGALPLELEPQQSQIVSATLGSDALSAGLIAGAVGVALAALYMLAYYRLLGLVGILSLVISGSLLWGLISWLGETQGLALTLAGITGIIVSIGVSLDSNIVYYENVKEDVRNGRTVRSAVDRAFTSAFSTIVKADVASLIGATLLYLLTIGSVRGFALYLGIATVLDLVASWFFMRPAARLLASSPRLANNPRALGITLPAEAS